MPGPFLCNTICSGSQLPDAFVGGWVRTRVVPLSILSFGFSFQKHMKQISRSSVFSVRAFNFVLNNTEWGFFFCCEVVSLIRMASAPSLLKLNHSLRSLFTFTACSDISCLSSMRFSFQATVAPYHILHSNMLFSIYFSSQVAFTHTEMN